MAQNDMMTACRCFRYLACMAANSGASDVEVDEIQSICQQGERHTKAMAMKIEELKGRIERYETGIDRHQSGP